MTFKEYYETLSYTERQEFRTKVIQVLEISRYVFYRWLNSKSKVPKCAQLVISAFAGVNLTFEAKNTKNMNNP